jgi:hypothetical protein
MVYIIVKGSRKQLVKRQKAAIDYVDKRVRSCGGHGDKKAQEAVKDYKRWSDESGIYDKREPGQLKHLGGHDWNGK